MRSTTTANPQQLDWFPVDAAKTLSHQDLLGLKLQERGAFWTLRLFCWKDGSVPASPKRLAVLCGATERQMERMVERLGHLLVPHPERPDRLIMPLVEEDRPISDKPIPPPAARPAAFSPQVRAPKRADVAEAITDPPPKRAGFLEQPSEEVEVGEHDEGQAPPIVNEPAKATERSERVTATASALPPPAERTERVTATATAVQPPAKRNSLPPTEETSRGTSTETETEISSKTEGEPPKEKLSFFMEQESVFDAHDFGLCAFSEAVGEPDRYKPERHYRMKASRRRIVATAIEFFTLDVARRAVRNLPLSLHLYDESNARFHPLDIERALQDTKRMARLFVGSDAELVEAIRERRNFPALERERLLAKEPAPWQPPTPSGYASTEDPPNPPRRTANVDEADVRKETNPSSSNETASPTNPQQSTFEEFES